MGTVQYVLRRGCPSPGFSTKSVAPVVLAPLHFTLFCGIAESRCFCIWGVVSRFLVCRGYNEVLDITMPVFFMMAHEHWTAQIQKSKSTKMDAPSTLKRHGSRLIRRAWKQGYPRKPG